jgi:GGDEF domain-containing protein
MARHNRSARPGPRAESLRMRLGRQTALVLLLACVTASPALLGWPSTGVARLVRDLVLANLAHLATAYLCWWPRAHTSRARRAWRFLAVALLLSTAGNVCASLIPSATLAPALTSPTIGGLLFLTAYPVLSVAAVLLVCERVRTVPAVWLDGLIIGFGSAAVVVAFAPPPPLRLRAPVSAQTVTDLTHPVADLTLLVVLAAVASLMRLRLDAYLALLGLGLAIHLLTDLAEVSLGAVGSPPEGGVVDVGRLLVLVLLAGAASLRPARRPDTNLQTLHAGRTAVAAPTVAALAALAVLMGEYHVALPLASGLLAGTCILVALLRAAFTLHQVRALPEARREARTDPLTDLANRRHMYEWCARLLARPDAAPVALLMIDLNGFKTVNDRHGHLVGDALLVEVATRFAATMRRDDLLGRLGGDEFAAILPERHRLRRIWWRSACTRRWPGRSSWQTTSSRSTPASASALGGPA